MATHNYTLVKKYTARTLKCEEGRLVEKMNDEEIELLEE